MSERRGRGTPQGDPSWGDAIWIEAPSVRAARERAARRGGVEAGGAASGGADMPEEELPDGVDPERLAAARARSAARRARAQAEREHVLGSGPVDPRRSRTAPRESPWAEAFGGGSSGEEDPAPRGTKRTKGSRGSRRRNRGREGRREPAPLPSDPDELRELARNIVLRHLTGAPRSRHQLEQRLADRGIPEEVGAEVLDRMEAVRLVDDSAFAETLVRSRHRGRGLARSALRRELKEKGVDGETAEEALEAVTGEDERAAAEELVAKKIRTRPVPTGRDAESRAERDKHVRRLVAMLGRKGYAPGVAFSVVREAIDAQDE